MLLQLEDLLQKEPVLQILLMVMPISFSVPLRLSMLREMEKTVDVWDTVAKGDLSPVTAWLTEKIHQYGSLKKPQDLLPAAMGGPLDPLVYTGYLKKKYGELYGL